MSFSFGANPVEIPGRSNALAAAIRRRSIINNKAYFIPQALEDDDRTTITAKYSLAQQESLLSSAGGTAIAITGAGRGQAINNSNYFYKAPNSGPSSIITAPATTMIGNSPVTPWGQQPVGVHTPLVGVTKNLTTTNSLVGVPVSASLPQTTTHPTSNRDSVLTTHADLLSSRQGGLSATQSTFPLGGLLPELQHRTTLPQTPVLQGGCLPASFSTPSSTTILHRSGTILGANVPQLQHDSSLALLAGSSIQGKGEEQQPQLPSKTSAIPIKTPWQLLLQEQTERTQQIQLQHKLLMRQEPELLQQLRLPNEEQLKLFQAAQQSVIGKSTKVGTSHQPATFPATQQLPLAQRGLLLPENLHSPQQLGSSVEQSSKLQLPNRVFHQPGEKSKIEIAEEAAASEERTTAAATPPQDNACGEVTLHQQPSTVLGRKPKRALSAYNFFFKVEREKLVQEASLAAAAANDGSNKKKKKRRRVKHGISFEALAQMISQKWKEVDPESLAHYEALARVEKERYAREMMMYTQQKRNAQEQERRRLESTLSDSARANYFSMKKRELDDEAAPNKKKKIE